MLIDFGNDVAIGDKVVSGNDFLPMSESPVDDDLEGENDAEETQPSHSTTSNWSVQEGAPRRRKRAKTMEDAVLPSIGKSSEMMVVVFDKHAYTLEKQIIHNYVNGQALLKRLKKMDID